MYENVSAWCVNNIIGKIFLYRAYYIANCIFAQKVYSFEYVVHIFGSAFCQDWLCRKGQWSLWQQIHLHFVAIRIRCWLTKLTHFKSTRVVLFNACHPYHAEENSLYSTALLQSVSENLIVCGMWRHCEGNYGSGLVGGFHSLMRCLSAL